MQFGDILDGVEYQERPAAYGVVMDDGGRVCAVRGLRGYFLPGGGSLPEETPEETIKRELLEELGRGARLTLKIGEAIQYFSVAGEGHYRMTAVFYKAELTGQQAGVAEYELEWLDLQELEEKLFHECHKWAVRESVLLELQAGV